MLLLFFIFNYLFVSLFILSGAGYCDGKADGNYRDPDNCYGYIACSNQIVYKMSCSSGLKYNEKLDQCDWPENVQCNPGKVHLLFSQRIFIISHCNVTKLSNWPLLFITYHGRVGGCHDNITYSPPDPALIFPIFVLSYVPSVYSVSDDCPPLLRSP